MVKPELLSSDRISCSVQGFSLEQRAVSFEDPSG